MAGPILIGILAAVALPVLCGINYGLIVGMVDIIQVCVPRT